MAEVAAEATPSTAAAPGAPSASPAPGPDIAAAPTPIDDILNPKPKARASARPIPSLPGVFPDEDPFPTSPSSDDRSAASPSRGADGRFLATPSSASDSPSVGEHAPQTGDDPAPPPPARFKFAGEEYATQAEAEQQVKSLRGQYKPIQSLARSLGGIEKIPETMTRAAESARAWKAEAEARGAELEVYRKGGTPAGRAATATPATAPTDTPAPEADVDWELYAEVKKLAAESGEPWKAEQWLINESRKIERARFDKTLDDRMAPFNQQQAQAEVDSRTTQLFGGLANYTLADGSPAFPELHDENTAFEVGKVWANMGLPPESALTTQGAIAAIALHRMLASGQSSQARTAAPAPSARPAPGPPVQTDAQSAAGLTDGRPSAASVPGNGAGAPSPEAARILAGLRSTRTSQRSTMLGFEP